jgi:hypothetical protein
MYNYTKMGGGGKYFSIHFEVYNALKISSYSTFYMEISSAQFSLKGQRIFRHNALSLCRILTCHVLLCITCIVRCLPSMSILLRNMINYAGITRDRSTED